MIADQIAGYLDGRFGFRFQLGADTGYSIRRVLQPIIQSVFSETAAESGLLRM